MKLSALALFAAGVAALLLTVGPAFGAAQHHTGMKTVTVVMHDPGCHWFGVGGAFKTKLAVTGPVALANFDEAALKVVGPKGAKLAPIGKKITLTRGTYKITMVGQAKDDNTLRLVVR